jgi:DNA-binding MarR family transcriptional regulator
LNRLKGLGYITRKLSEEDRRKSLVSLTQKGRNMVLQTRQEREDWLTELIANRYTETEKATIQRAVELLSILPNL